MQGEAERQAVGGQMAELGGEEGGGG
eukprot:COSAG06_NODE_55872_length_287_cov_1.101064_1_plen_25_part_01